VADDCYGLQDAVSEITPRSDLSASKLQWSDEMREKRVNGCDCNVKVRDLAPVMPGFRAPRLSVNACVLSFLSSTKAFAGVQPVGRDQNCWLSLKTIITLSELDFARSTVTSVDNLAQRADMRIVLPSIAKFDFCS